MTQYEAVTMANALDPAGAPVWQWEMLVDPQPISDDFVVVDRKGVVHTVDGRFEGWWVRYATQATCPFTSPAQFYGNMRPLVDGGFVRRPVTKPVTAPCACDEPESEAQALSRFFATPAGKWHGWQS